MRFIKKHGIIVAFISLGLASIITALMIFNYNITHNLENEMQSYLEEIRDNAIYILNNEFQHFEEILDNEVRAIGFSGNISEQDMINELKSFSRNSAMVRTMIMKLDGTTYSSNGDIRHYNPLDYKESLSRRKGGISQPRYSKTLDTIIVAVSSPICINGEYVGILIGEYDISHFETLFIKNFLDGDCAITIFTAEGEKISHSSIIDQETKTNRNLIDFYSDKNIKFINGSYGKIIKDLSNGNYGYAAYEYNNVLRYVSYAPTRINNWYLASSATQKSLLSRASSIRAFALQLAVEIVIIMLIVAIIIFFIRTKEQKMVSEILKKSASTDSLTKLYNKAATAYKIDDFLKNDGSEFNHAMMMIDIDGFKCVNDHLGHVKGDEILEEFAVSLTNISRDGDIIGRIGGDEFIVFVKNCDNLAIMQEIALKIEDAFRKTHISSINTSIFSKTSASIGIAFYPKDGNNFGELYHNADLALYASKNSGRDRYTLYENIEIIAENDL